MSNAAEKLEPAKGKIEVNGMENDPGRKLYNEQRESSSFYIYERLCFRNIKRKTSFQP